MKRFDILEHDACVLFGGNINKITGLLIDKKVSKEDYDLLLKGQDKYA